MMGESSPVEKVSALAIHSWQVTLTVSITKCLTAQKVDKLQTSLNGRVHSTSLQHLCHRSPRPAWRRVSWSRDGGYLRTERRRVFLLVPALVSGFVGWWCPFVLTLWRGVSPAEPGAAKRSSSYAQLDGWPSSHQHVPPAVQCQVVWAGEAAIAVRALEWLHARVFAVMPGQFIRASKLPGAAFPGALVGFLPWKKQRDTRFGAPSLFCNNQASATSWEMAVFSGFSIW